MPPFDGALVARFDVGTLELASRPCRPKILIVTDGGLSFQTGGFGLSRFIEAITLHSGVTTKPILTLAHRNFHPASVTIGPDTYPVAANFNFATATPAVTIANYDQIWLFGINPGGSLPVPQVAVIAEFMNSGGGVFATGDHMTLGRELCGSLPRIRHMRDWNTVPMGSEGLPGSLNRIDTIVDPGADGFYNFNDQSDEIPQRIYPHYKVTGPGFGTWQATVHPLLMRPGATAVRDNVTNTAGFNKDVDALPDHPHESVCFAVTAAAVLNGTYAVVTPGFEEFRPLVTGSGKVGAEIVASAVSGGRTVQNGGWKPPVTPRMFGVISAYDGRLAQPYPTKTARPGRIVCDSTWHHYVNINLDGTDSGRQGLGAWSGTVFTPSAGLLKIYDYYRNIVAWLQPANRVRCKIWWELAELRFNPVLLEELILPPQPGEWRQLVDLGRAAASLSSGGPDGEGFRDMLASVLIDEAKGGSLGDVLQGDSLAEAGLNASELIFGLTGGLLVQVAQLLPVEDGEQTLKVLREGPKRFDAVLKAEPPRLFKAALDYHVGRGQQIQKLSDGLQPLLRTTSRPTDRPA